MSRGEIPEFWTGDVMQVALGLWRWRGDYPPGSIPDGREPHDVIEPDVAEVCEELARRGFAVVDRYTDHDTGVVTFRRVENVTQPPHPTP